MYTFDFEDLDVETAARAREEQSKQLVEQVEMVKRQVEMVKEPVGESVGAGNHSAEPEPGHAAAYEPVRSAGRIRSGGDGTFLVLQPVGDLCERLQAVVSGGILANDLGLELGLVWTPDVACNCSWERLFAPTASLRVLDPAELGEQEEALTAAVELLRLWDMVCVASGHDDLQELALERFNRAHWSHFHAGLASFVDPTAAKIRKFHRLSALDWESLPDSLHAKAICIRAAGDFYPPTPGTRYGLEQLAAERSLFIQGLRLARALAQDLKDLDPGTVCIDAWCVEEAPAEQASSEEYKDAAPRAMGSWLESLEQFMDTCTDGSQELPNSAPFQSFYVVASEAESLQRHWSKRYKGKTTFFNKRASSGSVPQAVEDTLVSLATLARGSLVLCRSLGRRADVTSLLGSTTVQVVGDYLDSAATPSTSSSRNSREALSQLLDPSTPEGPFFAVGSWDDWKGMKELQPTTKHGDGQWHEVHEVRIFVKGKAKVEFQLLRNSDWGQRFFPTEDGLVWGPHQKHGANWQVQTPEGCVALKLVWNPQGQRSLEWAFAFATGEESPLFSGSQMQSVPFFIAGSWDGWRDFVQLLPGTPGGGPPYRAKIQVNGIVEFQVFRGRDWRQRFHPSAWGGKICGPSSGQGQNWHVETPMGCKWIKVTWDPRGHKSLRWRLISHNDRVMEDPRPKQSAPDLPKVVTSARSTLPTRIGNVEVPERLGSWRLISLLGRGYVGSVFKAKPYAVEVEDSEDISDDSDEEVAVKFPCLACEVDALKRLRKAEGVCKMLDAGYGPRNKLFLAMPILGPSLKAILKSCNHDGRGGRVSWQAARFLGVRLIKALHGIHQAGLVHCDVNPGNILFRLKDSSPQLIDFGWARNVGEAHFEKTIGTCMYNSIRAGFGGQRTPADDLESVGWLLLQLILGRLPWAERDEGVSAQQAEAWQRRSEGISVAKELFLADRSIFGPEFDFCPQELEMYLRLCQAAGPDPAASINYAQLVSILTDPYQPVDPARHWSRLLDMISGQLTRETLYIASRGLICYRPAGKPLEGGTEKVCSVTKENMVRTTGAEHVCSHGGRWVEVDPLWAPKLPPPLHDFTWLLISKVPLPKIPWEDDTQKNGPLLVPAGLGGGNAA